MRLLPWVCYFSAMTHVSDAAPKAVILQLQHSRTASALSNIFQMSMFHLGFPTSFPVQPTENKWQFQIYWACVWEHGSPNYWSPRALEKPLQWEACALHLESSPCSPELEKSLNSKEDPVQPKTNSKNKNKQ